MAHRPVFHQGGGWSYHPSFGQFFTPPFAETTTAPAQRKSFEDYLRDARDLLLREAGKKIAQTPAGRAAIREEVERQALAKGAQVTRAAVPALVPLALLGAVLFMAKKGRRRR